MSNVPSNLKHDVSDDGYETSATGDGSHLTQNGSHMMSSNQVMMPKCEISQNDDPYNFVDDDMQGSMSPHIMSSGMQQHMRVPYPTQSSLVGNSGNMGNSNVPKLASMHGNLHNMSSVHSPVLNSPPIDGSTPKKRGRKKKQRDDTG